MTEDIMAKIGAYALFFFILFAIWFPSKESLGIKEGTDKIKDLRF